MYHFTASGLDYVWLLNGFEPRETPRGTSIQINDLEGLHKVIAKWIVSNPARLRGQEVRFLRSMLGLSQEGLARTLSQSRATVARWEGEPQKAIPSTCDKWLRVVYASKTAGDRDVCKLVDLLIDLDEQKHGDREAQFEDRKAGWRSKLDPDLATCG